MGYFLSIEIPDHVVAQLQEFSLPDDEHIHPQRREDLHITLAYLGHIKDEKIDDLIHALHEIEIPPFEIDGQGVTYFGPGAGYRNHFFTAAITLNDNLKNLKERIDQICLDHGLKPRRHDNDYNPHITLARADVKLSQDQIDHFIDKNKNNKTPEFSVSMFALYKSQHPKPYLKIRDFKLPAKPV